MVASDKSSKTARDCGASSNLARVPSPAPWVEDGVIVFLNETNETNPIPNSGQPLLDLSHGRNRQIRIAPLASGFVSIKFGFPSSPGSHSTLRPSTVCSWPAAGVHEPDECVDCRSAANGPEQGPTARVKGHVRGLHSPPASPGHSTSVLQRISSNVCLRPVVSRKRNPFGTRS